MSEIDNYESTFGPSLANLKNTLSAYLGDQKSEKEEEELEDIVADVTDSEEEEESVRLNVEIIGDSILCGLKQQRMSRSHDIRLRNHGNCTSQDLALRRIDGVARRQPDVVILHVGTHDIDSGVDTTSYMMSAVRLLQRASPDTKIAVSSVVGRKDRPNIEKEVVRINCELYALCEDYSLYYLSNQNIEDDSLGSKKLHLNKKGESCLAVNFMRFLESIEI